MLCWLNTALTLFSQSSRTAPQPELQHEPNFLFQGAYDSKYISEGRDNLNEGGLVSAAAEWTTPFGNNELGVGTWYAEGTTANYSELNLTATYIVPFESVNVTFSYIWLDFAKDNLSGTELSIEFGTTALDSFDLAAAFVYSTEAGGTFVNLIASTEIVRNEFILTPYALLGINEGFVHDEHKGLNNLQFGIEASTLISDSMELTGYVAYTFALEYKPGESLDDIFWVGLGIGFGN
jgi:hypothetical protein